MILKGILCKKPNEEKSNIIYKYEFEYNDYKDWYKLLNIDIFTIVSRKIGNNYYDIICDDEGLLKINHPATVMYDDNNNIIEIIMGNIFICSHDQDGNLISLTGEEQKEILKNLKMIYDYKNNAYAVIDTKI